MQITQITQTKFQITVKSKKLQMKLNNKYKDEYNNQSAYTAFQHH